MRIQSMARWLSPEAVDIYDKLSATDHAQLIDRAYTHSPEIVTPAMLGRMRDIPIDDNDVIIEWSKHCFVDLTDDVQLDWS